MKSLRAQLTLRLLIGGALLLGVVGAALQWQVRRALTAEIDTSLRTTARSLVLLTKGKHEDMRFEFARENMPEFARANGAEVFLLREAGGREVERSHSLGSAPLPRRAGAPNDPEFFDTALPDGRKLRCVGLTFTARDKGHGPDRDPKHDKDRDENQEGSQDGNRDEKPKKGPPAAKVEGMLVVGRDRRPLDDTLATLRNSLLLVGGGALAILATLVRWGVRGGLAPLDRLSENVAVVEAASLATRFPVDSLPPELRPIAARLNELVARLEAAFARERCFTATAAHEFRTPLAELRALAEVNLTTPATDTERTESWRDALDATLRMESLTLRLLDLARAEDPARILHPERVSLPEALAAAWQPWSALAAERGVTIEETLPPDLTARTDPVLLGVILGNLCANAAEHAPSGSPLRVSTTALAKAVTLHFHNLADDLTPADVSHLFERFWRKDPARAGAQHHGLGLALAAEFAVLLNGTLTAQLSPSGDLEFAPTLPAA